MPKGEPDCQLILEQVRESLRAIKAHVVNFQLQLLLLSSRKSVENTDPLEDRKKKQFRQ
jgi:hypothetical protein